MPTINPAQAIQLAKAIYSDPTIPIALKLEGMASTLFAPATALPRANGPAARQGKRAQAAKPATATVTRRGRPAGSAKSPAAEKAMPVRRTRRARAGNGKAGDIGTAATEVQPGAAAQG